MGRAGGDAGDAESTMAAVLYHGAGVSPHSVGGLGVVEEEPHRRYRGVGGVESRGGVRRFEGLGTWYSAGLSPRRPPRLPLAHELLSAALSESASPDFRGGRRLSGGDATPLPAAPAVQGGRQDRRGDAANRDYAVVAGGTPAAGTTSPLVYDEESTYLRVSPSGGGAAGGGVLLPPSLLLPPPAQPQGGSTYLAPLRLPGGSRAYAPYATSGAAPTAAAYASGRGSTVASYAAGSNAVAQPYETLAVTVGGSYGVGVAAAHAAPYSGTGERAHHGGPRSTTEAASLPMYASAGGVAPWADNHGGGGGEMTTSTLLQPSAAYPPYGLTAEAGAGGGHGMLVGHAAAAPSGVVHGAAGAVPMEPLHHPLLQPLQAHLSSQQPLLSAHSQLYAQATGAAAIPSPHPMLAHHPHHPTGGLPVAAPAYTPAYGHPPQQAPRPSLYDGVYPSVGCTAPTTESLLIQWVRSAADYEARGEAAQAVELYTLAASTVSSAVAAGCINSVGPEAALYSAAHLVGIGLLRLGRAAAALPALQAALSVCPLAAEAHYAYAVAAALVASPSATVIAHLREAVRLCPSFADAHNNLGVVLRGALATDSVAAAAAATTAAATAAAVAAAAATGAVASMPTPLACDAEASLRAALSLAPTHAHALNNLGNELRVVGRTHEALQMYLQAIQSASSAPALSYPPALVDGVGGAVDGAPQLPATGRLTLSTAASKPAILSGTAYVCSTQPAGEVLVAAHTNIGTLLREMGDSLRALPHFHVARSYSSGSPAAAYGLAAALRDTGKLEEALPHARAAAAAVPNCAVALLALANNLKDCGHVNESIGVYSASLTLAPTSEEAFCQLVHAQSHVCDWVGRDARMPQLVAIVDAALTNFFASPVVARLAHPTVLADMRARALPAEAAAVAGLPALPLAAEPYGRGGGGGGGGGLPAQLCASYTELHARQVQVELEAALRQREQLAAVNAEQERLREFKHQQQRVYHEQQAVLVSHQHQQRQQHLQYPACSGGTIAVEPHRRYTPLQHQPPGVPLSTASGVPPCYDAPTAVASATEATAASAAAAAAAAVAPPPPAVDGVVITAAALPPLPVVQPFHALIYPLESSTFRALAAAYAVYAEALVAALPRAVQVWMPPLRLTCAACPHVGLPRPSWAPPRPHVDVCSARQSGGAGGGAPPPVYLPPLTTGLSLNGGSYLPDFGTVAATGAASVPPCMDSRRPHRLRVGYVSSDFVNHPYAHLTRSIYGIHATGCAVECYCYALTPSDGSQWRTTIEAQAEHFRDISGMDTARAAAAIAADGIHVLVNANGYTKGARSELFALRPAPVQVSFMGFAGTLAARSIDYALTDRIVTPPSTRAYTYAEALLLHPHSYFVCDHAQSAATSAVTSRAPPGSAPATPPPVSRARYGLPENTFLFCNFNQLYKIDAVTFGSWARILRACPHAKLWLLRFPADAETRIRAAAAAHGVPADTIIFTVRARCLWGRCGTAMRDFFTFLCRAACHKWPV